MRIETQDYGLSVLEWLLGVVAVLRGADCRLQVSGEMWHSRDHQTWAGPQTRRQHLIRQSDMYRVTGSRVERIGHRCLELPARLPMSWGNEPSTR